MERYLAWTLALGWIAAVGWEAPAYACSFAGCMDGDLQGQGEFIPANTPGLGWRAQHRWGQYPQQAPSFTLSAGMSAQAQLAPGGDFHELLFSQNLPLGPLQFIGSSTCTEPTAAPLQAEWTVGPAAPLPMSLGTLVASDVTISSIDLATVGNGGRCFEPIDAAFVDISLMPSAEATPWLPLLIFETYVDGQRWHPSAISISNHRIGHSWQGSGRDRLVADCGAANPRFPALAPGAHTVELRARLVGHAAALATAPLTVQLDCTPTTTTDESGGCACLKPTRGSILAGLALLTLPLFRRGSRKRR